MEGLLAPGMVLGRYELLAPVARGGMAEVWAARLRGSRGFQKIVAIKTILPSLSDDARFESMFLDEAALAARIHHPHVVEISDLGEHEGTLYLVMEWIAGETVAKVLRNAAGRVPLAVASHLVTQACAGLNAAHELRDDDGRLLDVVHRDVSPQNLMVGWDGVVKVVDFGIAKALGRLAAETAAGTVKGKVPYMAPEQALGLPVDRRTDVFALGTVYYFLLTGRHPFRGDDGGDTLRNVIQCNPRRPREIVAELPTDVEETVMTALSKDPTQRFTTMVAFEAAIADCMVRAGVTLRDETVKQYLAETCGDGEAARRKWLTGILKDADQRSATPVVEALATDVTATATAETRVESPGSGVAPARPNPWRARAVATALVMGLGGAALWIATRSAPQTPSSPDTAASDSAPLASTNIGEESARPVASMSAPVPLVIGDTSASTSALRPSSTARASFAPTRHSAQASIAAAPNAPTAPPPASAAPPPAAASGRKSETVDF